MSSDQPVLPLEEERMHSKPGKQELSQAPSNLVLGGWLAASRISCGYTLLELSSALRIQQFYLEALEREDLSSLPARPYVSGYVRSYAIRTGLDPREANKRLQHIWPVEDEAVTAVKALRFPDPPKERRFAGRRFAAVGLIAAVAAYAVWYFEAVRKQEPASLSPVAELEIYPAANSEPAASIPASTVVSEVVLGPLAPVSLQHLPADYVQHFVDGQKRQEANARQLEAMPEGPFPRPRPGTPAAAIWVKLYGEPKVPEEEEAAASPVSKQAGLLPVPSDEGLPSASLLSAYLPKLQLRSDLGPLNPGNPAVVSIARSEVPEQAPTLVEPIPHRRTQAFAAVPSTYQGDDGQSARPDADKDRMVSRVKLAAVGAASWIEIRDSKGGVVMSRLLKAGEAVDVPNQPGLKLTTGNAGALNVMVDGVTLPPLGKHRSVIRGILLDPASLMAERG